MQARRATVNDAEAMARIYSQGIEERIATFETRPRAAQDVRAWFDGRHPIVVVEEAQTVIAFAATFPYSHTLRAAQCRPDPHPDPGKAVLA